MTSKEIGKLVHKNRKSQKLFQHQLAGACGVGLQLIVDLAAGKLTI